MRSLLWALAAVVGWYVIGVVVIDQLDQRLGGRAFRWLEEGPSRLLKIVAILCWPAWIFMYWRARRGSDA